MSKMQDFDVLCGHCLSAQQITAADVLNSQKVRCSYCGNILGNWGELVELSQSGGSHLTDPSIRHNGPLPKIELAGLGAIEETNPVPLPVQRLAAGSNRIGKTPAELTGIVNRVVKRVSTSPHCWSVEVIETGHGRWTWSLAGISGAPADDVRAITVALGEIRSRYVLVRE